MTRGRERERIQISRFEFETDPCRISLPPSPPPHSMTGHSSKEKKRVTALRCQRVLGVGGGWGGGERGLGESCSKMCLLEKLRTSHLNSSCLGLTERERERESTLPGRKILGIPAQKVACSPLPLGIVNAPHPFWMTDPIFQLPWHKGRRRKKPFPSPLSLSLSHKSITSSIGRIPIFPFCLLFFLKVFFFRKLTT